MSWKGSVHDYKGGKGGHGPPWLGGKDYADPYATTWDAATWREGADPWLGGEWSSADDAWSAPSYAPTYRVAPGYHGAQSAQMPGKGVAAWATTGKGGAATGKGGAAWAAEAWQTTRPAQAAWPGSSPKGGAAWAAEAWQVDGSWEAENAAWEQSVAGWAPLIRHQAPQAYSGWTAEDGDEGESWKEEVRVRREEVYDPVVQSIDASNPWGNFTGTKNISPEAEHKVGPGATIKEPEQPPWETSYPAPQSWSPGKGDSHYPGQQTWLQEKDQAWSQSTSQQGSYHSSSTRTSQPSETRVGRRFDPEDKTIRTFAQVYEKYSHFFSEKEVFEYWDNDCKPVDDRGEATSQLKSEWKSESPSPAKATQFEVAPKSDWKSESPPPGIAKAHAEEKRLDPDDNKERTYKELLEKYSRFFTQTECDEYWNNDCKPLHDANIIEDNWTSEEKLAGEEQWAQGSHKAPIEDRTGKGPAYYEISSETEETYDNEDKWAQAEVPKQLEGTWDEEEKSTQHDASKKLEEAQTGEERWSPEEPQEAPKKLEESSKDADKWAVAEEEAENGLNECKDRKTLHVREEHKDDAVPALVQKELPSETAAQAAAEKARRLLEAHKKGGKDKQFLLMSKSDQKRYSELRLDPGDQRVRSWEQCMEYYKPYMRDIEQLKLYWDLDCRPVQWVEYDSEEAEDTEDARSKTDEENRNSADPKTQGLEDATSALSCDDPIGSSVADLRGEQIEGSAVRNVSAGPYEANAHTERAEPSRQKGDSKNSGLLGGWFNKIWRGPEKTDDKGEGNEIVAPTASRATEPDESPEDVSPF